jgi:ABC-type glycerol-3-phosphate transport system substrate-binding protein
MAMTMASAMAISATACQATEDIIKDGKTINVKVFSAGYGTDYIYALQEKFEAAFANEGYKLNIFTPLAGFSGEKVLQDIASDAGADVYFSTFVTEDQLAQDAYANTVADITELVYNQKPINFKGEDTGSKTIKQIMEEDSYGYIGYQRANGSYYSLPYQQGCRGLAVNLSVLDDYNLEIPKTSK